MPDPVTVTIPTRHIPGLLGGPMNLRQLADVAEGTILATTGNAWLYNDPYPVQFLGIVHTTRATYRGDRNARLAEVKRVVGANAGEVEHYEARVLRGPWADYVARVKAELAARQPVESAHQTLAAAAAAAGYTGDVAMRQYGDHAQDKVTWDLTPAEAERLAALLTANLTTDLRIERS